MVINLIAMTLQELVFAFVLVASNTTKANACVCYVGEEPNSVKAEPSLKLLPEQNLCECTEFRPGGVNTRQQAKPYEVIFGEDGHPEGWRDIDCIDEKGPNYSTSPCDSLSLTFTEKQGLSIPSVGKSFQSYPVGFNYTLHSLNCDLMEIDALNIQNSSLCTIELDGNADKIQIKGGNSKTIQGFYDTFDGSTPYWILINENKVELGRLGETRSIECTASDMKNKITQIKVLTKSNMTVAFQGTCPKDFEIFSRN